MRLGKNARRDWDILSQRRVRKQFLGIKREILFRSSVSYFNLPGRSCFYYKLLYFKIIGKNIIRHIFPISDNRGELWKFQDVPIPYRNLRIRYAWCLFVPRVFDTFPRLKIKSVEVSIDEKAGTKRVAWQRGTTTNFACTRRVAGKKTRRAMMPRSMNSGREIGNGPRRFWIGQRPAFRIHRWRVVFLSTQTSRRSTGRDNAGPVCFAIRAVIVTHIRYR